MSIHRLSLYLSKIENNTPIDYHKFITLIHSLSLPSKHQTVDIIARQVTGSQYLITDLPDELHQQLKKLSLQSGKNRISSSRQNRSHANKVDGSLLVLRKYNQHPFVLVFDKNGNYELPEPLILAKQAILIENMQNYIEIEKTLAFINKETDVTIRSSSDFIFADGNRINNSIHEKFLASYQQLYLFCDMDLGGLRIARNLNRLLPETAKRFIVPRDIEQRLKQVVETKPEEYINKVIDEGMADPFIAPYAHLIKIHRRTLEQESYLYEH